jgi:hypothetical protein
MDLWRKIMPVNIKKKFVNLDRNNFQDVCDLVDEIIEDIKETMGIDYEMGLDLMQDYMIDLINPDLLDFNYENIVQSSL